MVVYAQALFQSLQKLHLVKITLMKNLMCKLQCLYMFSLWEKILLVNLFYKEDEQTNLALCSYRSIHGVTVKGSMTLTNL